MSAKTPRMARTTSGNSAPGEAFTPSSALEALLTDLLHTHEQLLEVSGIQREAVRSADPARIQEAAERQAEILRQIARLEEQRRTLVNSLSAGLPKRLPGAGPVTLTELAGMMPEPQRTRLVGLAGRVREVVEKAAGEQRTLRAATTSLVSHMEGLMRQVARRLSHAGTYGRRGMVKSVPTVVSGLDLVT